MINYGEKTYADILTAWMERDRPDLNKTSPEALNEYRSLGDEEILKEGDEYRTRGRNDPNDWKPTNHVGHKVYSHSKYNDYRRKVNCKIGKIEKERCVIPEECKEANSQSGYWNLNTLSTWYNAEQIRRWFLGKEDVEYYSPSAKKFITNEKGWFCGGYLENYRAPLKLVNEFREYMENKNV